MGNVSVLFLAANPVETTQLRLDQEFRAISEKVRNSQHRESLQLVSWWAVTADDLLQSLNEHKPAIVHFSGHGSSDGQIILEDNSGHAKSVSREALRSLFQALKKNIRIVVLNACYSRPQAEAIAEVIDCVVGMDAAVSDQAAIVFAASFYRAIGFGCSVKEAFEQGKAALQIEGFTQECCPELFLHSGVDPSRLFLLSDVERPLSTAAIAFDHMQKPSDRRIERSKQTGPDSELASHSWVELPSHFVPRGGLTNQVLAGLREYKCVVLCSGAGTGKSVLVAQVAKRCPGPCMFYRFQPTDRDATVFLSWLVSQFELHFPGKAIQFKALGDLLGQRVGNQEAVASLMARLVHNEDLPQSVCLIIDDYHYVTQDARVQKQFDRLLAIVIDQTPSQFRFLIASRIELPLYTVQSLTLKNIGLRKSEAKNLAQKLGLVMSKATLEFLFKTLNGYFLAWRAALALAGDLTEPELVALLSKPTEVASGD